MIVGAYFTDGRACVCSLPELAGRLGISEYLARKCLNGKFNIPGVVLTKLPDATPFRVPEESVKVPLKSWQPQK